MRQETPSVRQNQLSGCHHVLKQFLEDIVESESSVYGGFSKSLGRKNIQNVQSRHKEVAVVTLYRE